MYFGALSLLTILYQLVSVVLCIWIAVLIFRKRSLIGWMVMIGAIASLLGKCLPFLTNIVSLPGIHSGTQAHYMFSMWVNVFANLLFLGGILLHLMQRRSESARLADLEAIIQDMAAGDEARMKSP
jgi:hypothetical protein